MSFDLQKTKAETYPERVTLVINHRQRDMIEEIARAIMRIRSEKYERITTNTVMRCLINLLDHFNVNLSSIKDEEDLNNLMQEYFVTRWKK